MEMRARRRLDIDDDGVFHIDQIIQAIAEHHLVAPARGPGRRGVGGRHRLGLLIRVDRRVLAFQRDQVLTHRAARPLRVAPIDLGPLDPLEAAGVGLDHAGIHGKALAADQTGCHAAADNLLEDLAQDIALAKTTVPVHREGRMVGNRVLEPEPAEPPVSHVEFHFLAQPAFRADRVAVADQEHPDQQLRANRGPADFAVMGLEFSPQPAQVQNRIDPAVAR